ncbi:F-box protein SKIP19-like [Lycium barbarum]|uniref:F-box protein SKIP19-like n=1 Tax=Lycium barbarum TaxID=112863 RepID=UPI00293E92C5|nr:F-box protein SKIP19-like [Lycium barbarum]
MVKNPPWLELGEDIWANILHRLGAIEILQTAQKVCTTWRRICKDPSMWRVITMGNDGDLFKITYELEVMCRHAIDRSQGELVDINLEYCATDHLLEYIAERSGKLRRLSIACCYRRVYKGFDAVAHKLPLLEELSLTHTTITPKAIEALGGSCLKLKSFELNNSFKEDFIDDSDEEYERNKEARAIAKSMPALHHLQLIGNCMSNKGLEAILTGCPHLESLDLRQCNGIWFDEDLSNKISRQIKDVKHPHDSLDGLKFSFEYEDGIDEYSELGDTSDNDYSELGDTSDDDYSELGDTSDDDYSELGDTSDGDSGFLEDIGILFLGLASFMMLRALFGHWIVNSAPGVR